MQTVRDSKGKRYLLIKSSGESSRVRDPATGDEQYLPNSDLEAVEGTSPLVAAAAGVPESVRRVMSAAHDERSLGLLIEVVDNGPLSVVALLGDYDLCESDLHGLLSEFRAAGLLVTAESNGKRGYDATEIARQGVTQLRDGG